MAWWRTGRSGVRVMKPGMAGENQFLPKNATGERVIKHRDSGIF